jgi:two-component system phosphate regulon response regulator PhoB/two-component system alkaline phosphatase synthesis response regulator PhoP
MVQRSFEIYRQLFVDVLDISAYCGQKPMVSKMHEKIAILEDDPDILKLVAHTLEKAEYKVAQFKSGKDFMRYQEREVPGLLILDLMLPDMDGMEICRTLRSRTATENLPIIMLTARVEEMDRVLGLEMGADDYVTKPFSPRELLARVRAVLRRRSPMETPKVLELGNLLRIDPERYEVFVQEQRVELTTTEFKLLQILAEKPGRVFSREQLLNRLWGNEKLVIDRTIDVHVKNLREKLGPAGSLIKNIRAVGYKIEL